MTGHTDTLRAHGYHELRVIGVIDETADTRSYVLDVPSHLTELFAYSPGQFCTFRVAVDGEELHRCYSMSSAPETDARLAVAVKRVPDGKVSNWFHDHVAVGDTLDVAKPAGVFCAREGDRPIIAFCGGSGVTPVISIVKSVLATTTRQVKVLYANRNAESVIFATEFDRLAANHDDRMELRHHLDAASGFLTADDISGFVGANLDADFYICGPTPFMDLAESTLLAVGVDPTQISIERFGSSDLTLPAAEPTDGLAGPDPSGVNAASTAGVAVIETVTLIIRRAKKVVPYLAGDTILSTARRAGLQTPFSCEAGVCATCMAIVKDGTLTMRNNDVLTDAELAEGWVLTCQAVPTSDNVVIEFE